MNYAIKYITQCIAGLAQSVSEKIIVVAVSYGKICSKRRMKQGRLRSLWGITPILTLPLLARCDRELGIESDSLVFQTYVISQPFDINLSRYQKFITNYTPFYSAFLNLVLAWALIRYDIFHYFYDRGILAPMPGLGINSKELHYLKMANKFLFTYAYGADVRTQLLTKAFGNYNCCILCPSPGAHCICDDKKGEANINRIREVATAMNSMGDMMAYVPGARNMHYWPLDINRIGYVGVRHNWRETPLRIAHIPNHSHFKGSLYLENAIEQLCREGYAVELISATGIPNQQVIELYSSVDIVADQFIIGFHGYAALEAMSLGKPVLCFIRNDEMKLDPQTCPIINVEPQMIYQILKEILLGEHDLIEIGKNSRKYVENNYSVSAIANQLGLMYLEYINPSAVMREKLMNKISTNTSQSG